MMAWAVTRAMEKHPALRCLTGRDGALAEQADFDLGVAVALPGDKLATAAIPRANRLAWAEFVTTYNREIEETRGGKVVDVQAPVNLTSLGAFGIEKAWPIVVPPAVATLFIGTAHEKMVNEGGVILPVQVVTLSITFDHRAVNGVGVAAFLQDLKRELEGFALPA
jgi:pyruvate/2-oxoglutarate dehydrogenase complex dihydrolipoamide acyltransferase (E2) component